MYKKWEKKLREIFGSEINIKFVRFFESKKNQVSLIELNNCRGLINLTPAVGQTFRSASRKIIMKYFVWGIRQKEEKILRKLLNAGISVPKVIKSQKDILFLEYITGDNLRVLYNKLPNPYCRAAAKYDELLARWLALFHGAFKRNGGKILLKGDMRLQNFILSSPSPLAGEGRVRGQLYGIDFEESSLGAPEDDLADLFATFLLQENNKNIEKYKERIGKFMEKYSKAGGARISENMDKLVRKELVKRAKFSLSGGMGRILRYEKLTIC